MSAPTSTNDWVVLALVAEQPTHGWALANTLSPGGELGEVWPISRPIVYHGLDRLEQAKLIRLAGIEPGGRGPHRVMFAATASGKKDVRAWLAAPVEHVRDIRSVFLLKVVLNERAGHDPRQLLVAQRAALVPFVGWLEAQIDDDGGDAPGETTAALFRFETASAIMRFIDGKLDPSLAAP